MGCVAWHPWHPLFSLLDWCHFIGPIHGKSSLYGDVIMSVIASQITSLTIVYSTVYLGADQRKNQSSASLAFVRGIHRRLVNSPHKGPVTRKMFPFDDVIMCKWNLRTLWLQMCCNDLTHWGRDKWTPFRRRHFQVHFLEWKCLNSDLNFTEVCSEGSN